MVSYWESDAMTDIRPAAAQSELGRACAGGDRIQEGEDSRLVETTPRLRRGGRPVRFAPKRSSGVPRRAAISSASER